MSDDALATARALLSTAIELIRDDDEVAREVALIPRVRDAVLPPDHPLRTGIVTEELSRRFWSELGHHPGDVVPIPAAKWKMCNEALRAALTVLRAPTQRPT